MGEGGVSRETRARTHTHIDQVHSLDLPVCFCNQATGSWPKPLVKDLSGNRIRRLRRAPPLFCLSMITGFTRGGRPLPKYATGWQQPSPQPLYEAGRS